MSETTLSHRQIARMIDISAVQAAYGAQEILELIRSAKEYGFGALHVLPAWMGFARSHLPGVDGLSLGSPVGFPSGGNHPAIKRAEALQVVADGADEIDMMINVGKLRSGEDTYVYDEMCTVITAVKAPVKVIIETHYLNDAEIRRACAMCIAAGAQFVKTSTGWAPTGATIENVALIAQCIEGKIGLKAAGGIRDLNTLVQMYKLGVRRFGINLRASIGIIEACKALPGATVVVTP